MQKAVLIFIILLASFATRAQVAFKTVLRQGPVVAGESFQVQYVLEDIDRNSDFSPPGFPDFRFVSGPYIYEGMAFGTDGGKKMKNYVYTLEAIKPGRFTIAGASAKVGDKLIKSDDVILQVISKAEAVKRGLQADHAAQNTVWLRPGEDPYEKMRKNLFLKVQVDKHTCFVGEPVTATFRLYSSLVSRSDIVKNPGFYGFTVQDMVGLDDKQSSVETINGRKFDVHTIRKVQLYPLRPGIFNIDPMEVTNEVKFSRSAVHKETEQEIVEGIFTEPPEKEGGNEEKYENSMSTPAIAINVKPSPLKNKPADFTGATGKFSINWVLEKNQLAKNEEGQLIVTISGKGNFTQLPAPAVEWPSGIEGFEPQVTDTLDHMQAPLKGLRTFRFTFVSAKPGHYEIPALHFSYFNPDSNSYKTVTTSPVGVTIENREKAAGPVAAGSASKEYHPKDSLFLVLLVSIIVLTGIAWWLIRSRKKLKTRPVHAAGPAVMLPTVSEILQPAEMMITANDQLFYSTLRDSMLKFFTIHFEVAASQLNRSVLIAAMQQRKVDHQIQSSILNILQQCETGMFTAVTMDADRVVILTKAWEALESLKLEI